MPKVPHSPAPRTRRGRASVTTMSPRRRRVLGAHLAARRVRERRSRGPLLAILGVIVILLPAVAWIGTLFAFNTLERVYGAPPDPRTLQADSMVLDRHGAVIADLHPPGESRIPVHLNQVAPILRTATIAVEDRNFWSEGAVDQGRLISAAWQDVVQGRKQGASTITEQLAKVLYLSSEQSLDRKLHEFFVARHLSTTYSKEQVLELYLNDIPYGHGATGIQAAAHIYFGVDASALDLAQASMLAGLPNAPALLDPVYHPKAGATRQRTVLQSMVATGAIDQAQADAAAAEPLTFADGHTDDINLFPMFTKRVSDATAALTGLDPLRAGLRITTTLDSALERSAQAAVSDQVSKLGIYHASDGAMVAVDPSTGEMLAYVGNAGPGYPASQIDMASTRNARQPGSTMKLFTYSAAIADRKVTMETPILDAPYSLPKGGGPQGEQAYTVHNYDLGYHGSLPVRQTLANSLNIPAVKVEQMVGVPRVVQQARSLGVTTLTEDPSSYGASLTLGTYPVPLWEMAQAATVFATGGVLHPTHELLSVHDPDGRELLPPAPDAKRVMDEGAAYIMNLILRTDANRALSFGLHSDLTVNGHLVAAKTGTTQDFRDNLTVGWTPHLAIATWVGNADYTPMRGTTGITGAAPIFHEVLTPAIANQNDDWPAPPADVYTIGQSAYLRGTDQRTNGGTTDVRRIGGCRYWTYNGGHYHWCSPGQSTLPGDPGADPNGIPAPYVPYVPGGPVPGTGAGNGSGNGGFGAPTGNGSNG